MVMFLFRYLSGFISQAVKLGAQANPVCRVFSIEELKGATKDFHLSTIIGEGSIGKVPLSFSYLKHSLEMRYFLVFCSLLYFRMSITWKIADDNYEAPSCIKYLSFLNI